MNVAPGINPLRISLDRVWIYGACCALVVSVPFLALRWFPKVAYLYDFACFWSAGATAGTRTVTDPSALNAWAHRHGMIAQPFSYLPGFAWAYWPLSRVGPIAGLALEEALMAALFVAAALIAARVYGYNRWFCVAATLGWAPAINSIEVGQNAGLALLLVLAATWALREKRDAAAGFATGMLLYKPTVALPMLLLLLGRRQWRALGISTACAAGWYLLSVAASGGNWGWPATYAHTMAWWLPMDFLAGSAKAFSVPTLLMEAGASLVTASIAAAGYGLRPSPPPRVRRSSKPRVLCRWWGSLRACTRGPTKPPSPCRRYSMRWGGCPNRRAQRSSPSSMPGPRSLW